MSNNRTDSLQLSIAFKSLTSEKIKLTNYIIDMMSNNPVNSDRIASVILALHNCGWLTETLTHLVPNLLTKNHSNEFIKVIYKLSAYLSKNKIHLPIEDVELFIQKLISDKDHLYGLNKALSSLLIIKSIATIEDKVSRAKQPIESLPLPPMTYQVSRKKLSDVILPLPVLTFLINHAEHARTIARGISLFQLNGTDITDEMLAFLSKKNHVVNFDKIAMTLVRDPSFNEQPSLSKVKMTALWITNIDLKSGQFFSAVTGKVKSRTPQDQVINDDKIEIKKNM